VIVGFSVFTLWRDELAGNWGNAAFAGFNAVVAAWAIGAYIGVRNSLVDIWLGLTNWMYVEVKPAAPGGHQQAETIDWRAVLYHGEASRAVPIREQAQAAVTVDARQAAS
jgi:hypothetical protein